MTRRSALLLCLALAAAPLAWAIAPPPPAPAYALSEGHTHGNLTVYFILGDDQLEGDVLTLAEAMAAKKVVVHETKEVRELAIENLGDKPVFLQAGDIVKGGQQDRTIAVDMLLPPKSGKVALPSFCVERGRWAKRGGEDKDKFSTSMYALTDNRLKLACRLARDQSEVWKSVDGVQKKLAENLKAEVRSASSATSLQLALENKKLQEAVEAAVKKLTPALGEGKGVIGYAVAINGKVNNADVFASAALFRKLYPKLLHASAVEAVAGMKEGAKFDAAKADAVKAFLAEARTGKNAERKTAPGQVECTKETKANVLFETRARGVLLRGSFLAK